MKSVCHNRQSMACRLKDSHDQNKDKDSDECTAVGEQFIYADHATEQVV